MKSLQSILLFLCVFLLLLLPLDGSDTGGVIVKPSMVKRGERKTLMVSEYGEIAAVDITTGKTGSFHLEFMTMEPNSLFLPVLLHADMVFYVNTGSGKLSWAEDGKEMKRIDIKRGDVYRLHAGSIFFVQSDLQTERQKLRIYSIYSNTDEDIYVPAIGAYSSISDQVLGFDRKMLTSAFNVGDDVVEEMLRATRPSAIVHALPEKKKSILTEIGSRLIEALVGNTNGDGPFYEFSLGKKKHRTYNILEAEHDFENCNGWSVTADKRDLKSLRHSNIGIFMVNLTKGSMMGPHWNPMATEIGIVLQGEGMIRVVCSSNIGNAKDCKNKRFRVKEGDVFTVPRFHPMAQMSFNNDTFVFMGFSTSTRKNYPQFLAGKSSVLQTLNRDILAMSFNVTNSTIGALLSQQDEAIILECTSCAEEEETKMVREEEERKRKEEEEERKRKEKEEEKKREEEEREREEAEAKEREEERKRKEEEKKGEEEEREREEAEAKERKRKEEEEERERREEEERKRKEKEEEGREREAEAKREEEQRKREERAKREQEERRRKRRQREKEEQERKERERKRQEEEGSGSGSEGQQEEEIRRRIMAARRLWKA